MRCLEFTNLFCVHESVGKKKFFQGKMESWSPTFLGGKNRVLRFEREVKVIKNDFDAKVVRF